MRIFFKNAHAAPRFIFANLKKIATDVVSTKLFRWCLYFLPLVIVVFNLLFHLLITLRIASINYDEFVLLAISKQPWKEFFDTTQVEPHPLGFYLLLRFFDFLKMSTDQIRVVVTVIFHLFVLFAVAVTYKTKLIQKLNLKLGFSLALSSFSIFEIGCEIKQDIISFPFFFLFLICGLSLTTIMSKKMRVFAVVLLFISSLIVTFFSYIYFAYMIVTLVIFMSYGWYKKNNVQVRLYGLCLFTILSAFTFYFIQFGHYQIENNYLHKNRFLWTIDVSNSALNRLPEMAAGVRLFDALSDVFVLCFLVLAFLMIQEHLKQKKSEQTLLLLLMPCFILVAYGLRLYVQNRYAVPAFLLFCIICGIQSQKKVRFFLLGLILFLLYAKSAALFITASSNTLAFQQLNLSVNELSPTEKTGLISNVPGVALYIKLRFLKDVNQIYPISTSKNVYVIPVYSFNRQHFAESSEKLEKTSDQLDQEFRALGFQRFIYIESKNNSYEYYDPEKRIKNALFGFCRTNTTIDRFQNVDMYIFTDCK